MSQKVPMAESITIGNCECCGGVVVQLWRNGKMFAVACPANADPADCMALDLSGAASTMRKAGGKPHVH